jgi:hypothetical protein
MIYTFQGRLADGARRTVVRSYRLNLGYETEFRIKAKEILFDDAYLSKVVDDRKTWFTGIEVLELIYPQFLYSANSLRCQPTSSQYLQPLATQTSSPAATAIYCALAKYTSGKEAMVMFSQDEYQGPFAPSPVFNFILEATTQLITHQWPYHTPPPATPSAV